MSILTGDGVPHFRQSHNMGTLSWGPEDDFLPDMASHVSVQGCNGGIYQPSSGASRGLGERPFLVTIAGYPDTAPGFWLQVFLLFRSHSPAFCIRKAD